jgi:hypothetical protein
MGKEDHRENGGSIEWKGEGTEAREVEISRKRKIVIRGEGKKKS